MTKIKHYFFFGFGQVGKYYVKDLLKKKKKFKLSTTSTNKTSCKSIGKKKFISYFFKGNIIDKRIKEQLKNSEYILISIPPKNNTDLVLKNFQKELKKGNFKNLIYLSSTSVYGNHNGKWVNEKSKLKPRSKFGKQRLKCEKQWLRFQRENNLNINILRLSGIYSKENNAVKRLKSKMNKVVAKKNHYFSRIRAEDISQAVDKTFSRENIKGQVFNVSDNRPASSLEVYRFAAKILKRDLEIIHEKNLKNSMLKEFYRDSKKVDNSKIKKVLKLKLKFPTYKEGLKNLLN